MLKEEIDADATIFKAGELQGVYPVNNIRQISRYRQQEQNRSGQNFEQVLHQVEKNQKEQRPARNNKLPVMGGLNQYNRQGIEFCYILSSETDYRA